MLATETFEDYYELLQLSPNAEGPIIQCVYTLLSQRYHPGNKDTGDDSIYEQLLKAKGTLSNPDRRASYDVKYKRLGMRFRPPLCSGLSSCRTGGLDACPAPRGVSSAEGANV